MIDKYHLPNAVYSPMISALLNPRVLVQKREWQALHHCDSDARAPPAPLSGLWTEPTLRIII